MQCSFISHTLPQMLIRTWMNGGECVSYKAFSALKVTSLSEAVLAGIPKKCMLGDAGKPQSIRNTKCWLEYQPPAETTPGLFNGC